MAEYYSSPYTGKEIDEAIDAVQKKVLHQDLATEQYVLDKVKELQDSVDQTYNPESRDAQSGVAVAQAVSNRVEKVAGKDLSTNDYTDEDKEKVDSNRKTIYVTPDGYIYDKNTEEKITVVDANIVKDLYNIEFVYVDTSAGSDGDTYNVPLQVVFGGDPGHNSTIELFGVDKKRNKRLHGEYVVDEYGSTTGNLFVWTEATYNIENIRDGIGVGSLYMNNTSTLSEPDDGGELHPTPDTTSTTPIAAGSGAFAVGIGTEANGDVSVAEGILTKAGYLRADGTRSIGSHAEGVGTYAKSSASHAEGYHNQSLASNSHTEGFFNTVESTAWSGHAEGRENTVSGVASHAEGANTTASGECSHAEGKTNIASGKYSHVGGLGNTAANFAGTVIGQYAKLSSASATKYDSTGEAFVVGNGTSDTNRSNAFEVRFNGTAKLGGKNVATENYVDASVKEVSDEVNGLKSDLNDLPQLEKWDLAHRNDVVIYEKTYLSDTGTTIEEQLTSHDSFFTLLIPVNPNTTYYGFDEKSNSEYDGRFAGVLRLLDVNKNITKSYDNPVLSITTDQDTAYIIMYNRYIDATTQNKGIYWFTDKGESDRIDTYNLHGYKIDVKDIINLIIPEIDETLSIRGKVADAKAVGDAMRSVGGAEIQPRNFPILPYKVVKTNDGYLLKDDIYDVKNISNFRQIYVDSVNGSDSNNGTSQNTAYKTLKKALGEYNTANADCCVNILGDSVFYADELYGELTNRKSLAIIGENKPKLIHGELPMWSVYDSDNNTYSATVSFTGKCCVDMANVGLDGLFEGMKAVSNASAVTETENSYYIDGTTAYVHPISGNDASNVIVLKSGYGVRWNHATSTTDHFLYMKNLNIIGGYYDLARSSAYQVIGVKIEFFAEDCILQHNPIGDGFPHNGYDVSYNINCNVGFSNTDCFNHHHSGCTTEQVQNSIIVDINCKAREAGYYRNPKQGNDNLFTCHDGENVLRLNCRGMTAPGPSFADVNGCRSVLVDCESYNNYYSELAINGAWQFNNVDAIRNGMVTLVGCRIYDCRNTVKLNSECDIEMMDTPVFDSMNITGKLLICNGI